MNFKDCLQKIEDSETFKNFISKNPNSELCAGFFILDFKEKKEDYNIDYKINDKITTFSINPTTMAPILKGQEDILDKSKPLKKVDPAIEVEIPSLKLIIEKEMANQNVKGELEKIIAVLQTDEEGKTIWNLTCMISGMKIMISIIDAKTEEIIKFDKKSLFDFIRPSS